MQLIASGHLSKMATEHVSPVAYTLNLGDEAVAMNELIGKPIKLSYEGDIKCGHCGRKTKKSFNQGYCYPCLTRLAQCDRCIMSPELCHFAAGTCREPEWGETNCNVPHVVYLANSSHIKVGITRGTQVPTRWMDQGAIQALPIATVTTRFLSGQVEVMLKALVSDRTSWQTMLKQAGEKVDLAAKWQELQVELAEPMQALQDTHGINAITWLNDGQAYDFEFPVSEYPTKVKSFNFDKTPEVEGKLMGIKGQYLIMDTGVINLRKFTAYNVSLFA